MASQARRMSNALSRVTEASMEAKLQKSFWNLCVAPKRVSRDIPPASIPDAGSPTAIIVGDSVEELGPPHARHQRVVTRVHQGAAQSLLDFLDSALGNVGRRVIRARRDVLDAISRQIAAHGD